MYSTGLDLGQLLVFWLVGTAVVYVIAKSRDLEPTIFVGISLILSPIVGAIFALVSKPGNRAPCWQCRELVIRGASKCPHCGAELTWPGTPTTSS